MSDATVHRWARAAEKSSPGQIDYLVRYIRGRFQPNLDYPLFCHSVCQTRAKAFWVIEHALSVRLFSRFRVALNRSRSGIISRRYYGCIPSPMVFTGASPTSLA